MPYKPKALQRFARTCSCAAHHADLPAGLHLEAQPAQHQRQPRPVPAWTGQHETQVIEWKELVGQA
jgi:hypothetical protein